MRFRLATWNINSVRLRLDLVSRLIKAEKPDVLCLQEIKCIEDKFPELELRALGFPHIAVSGQKGYHGVAILSRLPFTHIERRDICGRGHARHLSVRLGEANGKGNPLVLHNVYVPAGGDIPDPAVNDKFRHKLDFLEAMSAWFGGMRGKAKNRMIMVGDLNVAPLPTDVWSHKQLLKVVSHTPQEVERLDRVQASHDFVDVMRRHVPASREAVHLVELSQSRLARVEPRAAARPYLDHAGSRRRRRGDESARRGARLAAHLRPRAGHRRFRGGVIK